MHERREAWISVVFTGQLEWARPFPRERESSKMFATAKHVGRCSGSSARRTSTSKRIPAVIGRKVKRLWGMHRTHHLKKTEKMQLPFCGWDMHSFTFSCLGLWEVKDHLTSCWSCIIIFSSCKTCHCECTEPDRSADDLVIGHVRMLYHTRQPRVADQSRSTNYDLLEE